MHFQMKAYLHFLLIALLWPLVTAQDDALDDDDFFKDIDADFNVDDIAFENEFQEIVKVAATAPVDVPYDFVTIRQTYASPENRSNDDAGLLSTTQLSYHADLMATLARASLEMFGMNWTLADICFKPKLAKPTDKLSEMIFRMIERFLPCTVVSPLDCFLEGAFIHGPYPPFELGAIASFLDLGTSSQLDWTNFDPESVLVNLQELGSSLGIPDLNTTINKILDVFEEMDVKHGYSQKLCLDPEHPKCPATAANKDNATLELDVGSILGFGCSGIIKNFMQWEPKMFLDGFAQNSPEGPIASAESLATTILLANASDIFDKFTSDPGAKPGLDRSSWVNKGAAGTEELISEWADMASAILDNYSRTSGAKQALFDAFPNENWIDASKVHDKIAVAGIGIADGFEHAFKDYAKLLKIISKQ